MRVLKIAGIVAVSIIALFFIISLFLPSSYVVERSIVINHPADSVFNKVANFNYYLKWNPWSKMEPTAQNSIEGTPISVGHKWSWKGKEVGEGSLTITELYQARASKTH